MKNNLLKMLQKGRYANESETFQQLALQGKTWNTLSVRKPTPRDCALGKW